MSCLLESRHEKSVQLISAARQYNQIVIMFSFISFRRNINYLLPRLLDIWKPDILPRIINCYDVHAYMTQHQYSAYNVYIITVYISLWNILKG